MRFGDTLQNCLEIGGQAAIIISGADLLLQVRCAVHNGTAGSAYVQKFQPANDSSTPMAITA